MFSTRLSPIPVGVIVASNITEFKPKNFCRSTCRLPGESGHGRLEERPAKSISPGPKRPTQCARIQAPCPRLQFAARTIYHCRASILAVFIGSKPTSGFPIIGWFLAAPDKCPMAMADLRCRIHQIRADILRRPVALPVTWRCVDPGG